MKIGPTPEQVESLTDHELRQAQRWIGEQAGMRQRLASHRRKCAIRQAIAEVENEDEGEHYDSI